ncbi:phosphatidylinositol-4-phosphate 5-Kinase, partial [Reticulomyxa filosa]
LCGSFNLLEFISNSKSGQFFFYSHDGQFLIKSMTRSESLFLRKILPPYYHYVQGQPNTLITRFYGMYRVKVPGRKEIYFVVMGSVFHSTLEIHKIYDLKGSTHGRRATEKDREQAVPVLKDVDFEEDRQLFRIGKKQAKLFKDQLRKDVEVACAYFYFLFCFPPPPPSFPSLPFPSFQKQKKKVLMQNSLTKNEHYVYT